MRFRETVLTETLDLAKDLPRKLLAVTASAHAVDQLVLEGPEAAAPFPCGHGAPQTIGFARRETGGNHGQSHRLFLEDGNAQCLLQYLTNGFIGTKGM